jgi:fucose permease
MNWLHAFFGLGVAIGPLIMTTVIASGLAWRWGYGVVATAQAVLALAFAGTAGWWQDRHPGGAADAAGHKATAGSRPLPVRETLALPAVWFGALTFAVYVAIEMSAGLWAFLLLTEGRRLPAMVAGLCVSGYWASLFVGRVVQGFVAERLGSHRVLVGSLAGVAAGALLVALPAPGWVAVAGLAVIGFGAAPVFPLLTLTTADRVGAAHADRAIGLQVGTAGLGGAAIPAAIGLLLSRIDVEALGPALVVLALAMIALYAAAARPSSAAARRSSTAELEPMA